MEESKKLTSIQ